MAYSIGQVLYVVSQKTQNIVPVQVVERVVTSTLRGEQVMYRVMGPKGEGPHDLEQIDGQIYTDAKKMRAEIRQKAITAIDRMVDRSLQIADQAFKARAAAVEDGGLALKQSINGSESVHAQQEEEAITLEEGEIEIGVDPDGKPIKARVRSVSESPAPKQHAS